MNETDELGTNKIIRFLKNPYFALKAISIFLLWVLASEYAPVFLVGGDSGALIWTTMHFILNPILGVILAIILAWNSIKQENILAKTISFIGIILPLFVSYVGFTGNTWVIEFLGISF